MGRPDRQALRSVNVATQSSRATIPTPIRTNTIMAHLRGCTEAYAPSRTGQAGAAAGLRDRFEAHCASLPNQIGHLPDVPAGRYADPRRV